MDLTPALSEYVTSVSPAEPDVLRKLREETARTQDADMQISPDQGMFFQFLIRASGAKRCLEIGVFTGYSSISMALALPDDGRITACDKDPEWTAIARRYWRAAGVEHKIDLRLAPALATLDALIANGEAGTYDFVFIDADKSNYDNYWERSLVLTRPGGIIAVDNVLWYAKVIDQSVQDQDTVAIRAFNRKVAADPRVFAVMLPMRDGVTLGYKR